MEKWISCSHKRKAHLDFMILKIFDLFSSPHCGSAFSVFEIPAQKWGWSCSLKYSREGYIKTHFNTLATMGSSISLYCTMFQKMGVYCTVGRKKHLGGQTGFFPTMTHSIYTPQSLIAKREKMLSLLFPSLHNT